MWVLVMVLGALLMGCGGNDGYPSVSDLSREWGEIKTELWSVPERAFDAAGGERIDRFRDEADRFFASPVGTLYQVYGYDAGRSAAVLKDAAERLKGAALAADGPAVFAAIPVMDSVLAGLQGFDADFSNSMQSRSFKLSFFFSIMIMLAVLVSWRLYVTMEKAQSRERQSRAFSRENLIAQEEERSRIARELHDSVAQDLWRLSFQADSIGKADSSAERRRLAAEVAAGHRELIVRIRRICDGLIPPDFLRRGLADSLRRLCYDFERRTGIECRVSIQEELRLDGLNGETRGQCFRLVQEALGNVEKHARASETVVLLRNTPGEGVPQKGVGNPGLLLCVSDDGRGFEIPGGDYRHFAEEGHFGIRNMYERAAILQGKLSIDSEIGEGTIVTL